MEKLVKRQTVPSIEEQIEEGTEHVLQLLLYNNEDISLADKKFILVRAASEKNTRIVRLVLEDKRFTMAPEDMIMEDTTGRGYTEIVRLLLEDGRTPPGNALEEAVRGNYSEIVRMLLADDRVDPATNNSIAIQLAADFGYTDVLRILLEDRRVDPAAINHNGEQAILFTKADRWKPENTEAMLLLLDDGRADWRLVQDTVTFQVWKRTRPQTQDIISGYEEGLEDVVQQLDIRTKIAREAEYIRFCKDIKRGKVPPQDLYELATILGMQEFQNLDHDDLCTAVRRQLDSIGIAKPLQSGRL